jgi:hypothetical protein
LDLVWQDATKQREWEGSNMEILNVIAAAAASWVFGAIWYMALAKPWVAASGIEVDENGRPVGGSALPYILSALAMVLVAGMMRHIIDQTQIDTAIKGIMVGGGIGLFMISPWIMINNAYGMRPFKLTLIDGGYATIGCGIMGLVLMLF